MIAIQQGKPKPKKLKPQRTQRAPRKIEK